MSCYGDDGMYVDAELLLDFHDSGLAAVLAHLAAVDRDEHIRDVTLASPQLHDRRQLPRAQLYRR